MIQLVEELLSKKRVDGPSCEMYKKLKNNWDRVAKPLDSMGKFEHYISLIGAILGSEQPHLDKSAVLVFAADNGITKENISQSDQSVTAACVRSISSGCASVSVMAKVNQVETIVVDIGVNAKLDAENVLDKKVCSGTRNFLEQEAMTRKQCIEAVAHGMSLVKECKDRGKEIIAVGEIGIGNTTTSSAVAASLLGLDASQTTGKGAGLSDEGLLHKTDVINRAIEKYDLYNKDPLYILSAVGGLDIAGMVGAYLGGAYFGVPIVLDGVISMVAALVANRLVDGVKDYMIPSHSSREPAAKLIERELSLSPVLCADMALGEGTGAVMMIGLLNTAYKVYQNGNQFENIGVEQYVRL